MAITALNAIPYHTSLKLAVFAGRFLCMVDRRHRGRAEEQLRLADPPVCPPHGIQDLVRRIFEHAAMSVVEVLRIPSLLSTGRFDEISSLERSHVFDRLIEEGRGALVVIAHLGNWEIGGVALARAGYPLHSLARTRDNPYLDRYLNRFRTMTGQRIIPSHDALPAMMRTLLKNEFLAIQADVRVRRGGILTQFFGRPAPTIRSPALISLRSNAPIVPIEVFRERGRHIVRLHDPIEPAQFRGRDDASAALTQAISTKLESFIRNHPDQWFWAQPRWRGLKDHLADSRNRETAMAESSEPGTQDG